MPTIILFDLSLSMCRSIELNDTSETYTYQNLANYGLIELLDYMSLNNKMEYVSLIYFSQLWDRECNFTRDYDSIKLVLANNFGTYYNSTNIENALKGAQECVIEEWGQNLDIPIQILLITDGNPSIDAITKTISKTKSNNKDHIIYDKNLYIDEDQNNEVKQFKFPCKLHIINLCTKSDLNLYDEAIEYYKTLITETSFNQNLDSIDEQLHYLDSYSLQSVSNLFKNLAIKHYMPFNTDLRCGNLMSPITIYPSLKCYSEFNDKDLLIPKPSLNNIVIYGFLDLSEISSPPIHSRHIILPNIMNCEQHLQNFHSILNINSTSNYDLNSSVLSELEDAYKNLMTNQSDDPNGSKQPSLCVLLHGSLKIESMVAICKIGEPNWFGILYSWTDNKKKSNLMLSTLKYGSDSIDWLGNLNHLGLPSLDEKIPSNELTKLGEKKSYAQNCVVWIKQSGLYSDIQKVLRLAKKLPDKEVNFNKELTKFKKTALTIGFNSILEGLSIILERECSLLPNNSNQQIEPLLRQAIQFLRTP